MMTPVRLQLSRKRGFDLQAASIAINGLPAVNVARPSLYGNPFVHPDPAVAVEAYRRLATCGGVLNFHMGPGQLQFAPGAHPDTLHYDWGDWLRTVGLPRIRRRNVACWCGLDAPCHGDVLLALARSENVQPQE